MAVILLFLGPRRGFRFVLDDLVAGTACRRARDGGDYLLLRHFGGAEVTGRAAEAKYDDAVADLEDVGKVVADDDDAEVRSRRRLISASTCLVWGTPSAAVGSSSITTFGSPSSERATATYWR